MEGKKGQSRVCLDGVFDMIHSGHFNAIRQAKQLGDILVLCIDSEEEVLKNKGPMIFRGKERRTMIEACKWVDEIQEDFPYFPTLETMDKFNLDFMAHGDDLVVKPDGTDCYGEMQKANRFKIFKRTEGISTSAIVGRILLTMERKKNPENAEYIDKKRKKFKILRGLMQ
jgi:ethanolamine-phosphate cytidylyltransferase